MRNGFSTPARVSVVWAATFLFALPLFAQEESSAKPSTGMAVFFTVLPVVIIFVLLLLFFRPFQRKNQQHVERHRQHMDRVEQSLERIAAALEKKS